MSASNFRFQKAHRPINEAERKDDLVRDMVDVLTSFCARLYGRRSAKNRAKSDGGCRKVMMNINRAYRTELDPNNAQRTLLLKSAGTARFAWNWGLQRRIEEYNSTGKSSNAIAEHRQLNDYKKAFFPWMYLVSKCCGQEALRDLDRAYRNFFEGRARFPRFKSKKRGVGSFRLTGSIRVFADRIQLPRLGTIRLKEKGYIPTDACMLSATVSGFGEGGEMVRLRGSGEGDTDPGERWTGCGRGSWRQPYGDGFR